MHQVRARPWGRGALPHTEENLVLPTVGRIRRRRSGSSPRTWETDERIRKPALTHAPAGLEARGVFIAGGQRCPRRGSAPVDAGCRPVADGQAMPGIDAGLLGTSTEPNHASRRCRPSRCVSVTMEGVRQQSISGRGGASQPTPSRRAPAPAARHHRDGRTPDRRTDSPRRDQAG